MSRIENQKLGLGDKLWLWFNPKGSEKGKRGTDFHGTVVEVKGDGQNIVIEDKNGNRKNIGKGTVVKGISSAD